MCPHYERLAAIFAESVGGTVDPRGDTLHDNNRVADAVHLPGRDDPCHPQPTPPWLSEDEEDGEEGEEGEEGEDEDGEDGDEGARDPPTQAATRSFSDCAHGRLSRGDKAINDSNDGYIQELRTSREEVKMYRRDKLRIEERKLKLQESAQRIQDVVLIAAGFMQQGGMGYGEALRLAGEQFDKMNENKASDRNGLT